MKIEVPVHATIKVNGIRLICVEDDTISCDGCALHGMVCFRFECAAEDRSDGKNIIFQPFVGVSFDKWDIILNIPDIKHED